MHHPFHPANIQRLWIILGKSGALNCFGKGLYISKSKIFNLPNFLSLAKLLIKESNFRTEPFDFQTWRAKSLEGLENFLPKSYEGGKSKSKLLKKPVLFNAIAAASQVKNSFQIPAGHLKLEEKKLFYIRLAKSASTSIASEFLSQKIQDLKTEILSSTQINLLADAWLDGKTDGLETFTGFTIVRNPLERLVSIYRDIFSKNDQPFIYQNYLAGVFTRDLTFDEFVYRISQIPDRVKDQHIKPQYLFIKPYLERKLHVKIFKLEQAGEVKEFLATFGLNLPHLNKGSDHDSIEYYSKSTLERAKKLYAQDFELFNYER